MTRIHINIDADFDLPVGDVWPDGDEPDEITADAVRRLMEDCGRKARVLDDWNFLDDLRVTVRVDDETVEVWA